MAVFVLRLIRLARNPRTRKLVSQAHQAARSPQARKLLAHAQQAARDPKNRKRLARVGALVRKRR
jgi:hypothetical protein